MPAAGATGAGAGAAAGAVVVGAAGAGAGTFSAGFEQAIKLIDNKPAAAVINNWCFISNFSLEVGSPPSPDGGRITGKTIQSAKWMTRASNSMGSPFASLIAWLQIIDWHCIASF